jgi:aminopeptidase-like protein
VSGDGADGDALHAFASQLYPICRSITGDGVRRTLALIRERIPLEVREVPSGSKVFDWEVPDEWNIDDAAVEAPDGERVVDFRSHNLHIVSYSEPVSASMTLSELEPRLHSLPERPDWIPYRTSYYRRSWGFCLAHSQRTALRNGRYRVEIKSTLKRGSLTYGELAIPGRSRDEVLFFTHVCHPSLANDNASGMAVTTALAEWIASAPRRFTYRFVFAPGTIGSLCWLRANERKLGRIRAGLVLGLLGDPGALTYKASRRGDTQVDRVAGYVVSGADAGSRLVPFSPYGYDERQLCSPGFDLPVGRLTRSANGEYPEYHTSADDLELIRPESLGASLDACRRIVETLEEDFRYVNRLPKGEPRLGKRGLYGTVGGSSPSEREHAMLWVLNQSDGGRSILDIAGRSGLPFRVLAEAARALEGAKLLRDVESAQRVPRGQAKKPARATATPPGRRATRGVRR